MSVYLAFKYFPANLRTIHLFLFFSFCFCLSGMDSLFERAMHFLKTGLGLLNSILCVSCTGCRHGNLLLTGTYSQTYKKLGGNINMAIFTGPRGSGRTSIARSLCNQLEHGPFYVNTVFIDCSSLKGIFSTKIF